MNRRNTTLLLSLLTIFMVTMGSAIGGTSGMVFAFVVVLGMSFFSSWSYGTAPAAEVVLVKTPDNTKGSR